MPEKLNTYGVLLAVLYLTQKGFARRRMQFEKVGHVVAVRDANLGAFQRNVHEMAIHFIVMKCYMRTLIRRIARRVPPVCWSLAETVIGRQG